MTALPANSDFNASTNTEGQLKTAFTALLAYLSGTLGNTGTVGGALSTLGALAGTYVALSGAYTVVIADRGKAIDATANSWTLGLPAVASAGVGFSFVLRNSGTGIITIDPSGSELLDGAATVAVPPGQALMIICTGTAWVSHWMVTDLTGMPTIGFKQPCRLLADTNINLATGGLLTVDGVASTAGMRCLCVNQTAPAENGPYIIASGAWQRAPDADDTKELAGGVVIIERGNKYGGKRFVTSWKSGSVLGTASMVWSRLMDDSEPLSRLMGYTTTATAAGTTTLSLTSSFVQVFTGTAAQSVVMPSTASGSIYLGFAALIYNGSTGTLTIKANDGSTITTVLPSQSAIISCNSLAADTSAVWTVIMKSSAGGVIDRGSNVNGQYSRYGDGTLECWTSLAASTSAAVTWTYPYAFNAAPVVNGNAQATVLSGVCLDAAPGLTTATFSARDKTDARRADTCNLHAIGRWF